MKLSGRAGRDACLLPITFRSSVLVPASLRMRQVAVKLAFHGADTDMDTRQTRPLSDVRHTLFPREEIARIGRKDV